MSYNAPYSANVHGMSHYVMAEAISHAYYQWDASLGAANALLVLRNLVDAVVNEKIMESQADGARNFVDAIRTEFHGSRHEDVIRMLDFVHNSIINA